MADKFHSWIIGMGVSLERVNPANASAVMASKTGPGGAPGVKAAGFCAQRLAARRALLEMLLHPDGPTLGEAPFQQVCNFGRRRTRSHCIRRFPMVAHGYL